MAGEDGYINWIVAPDGYARDRRAVPLMERN